MFLRTMPEALDEFLAVEMIRWGAIKVVSSEERADCIATFGRTSSRKDVTSTGSSLVPGETTVREEAVRAELPTSEAPFVGTRKSAAMMLVHRATQQVVWADSKSDGWSFSGGSRGLAKKLVDQLRRDLGKIRP